MEDAWWGCGRRGGGTRVMVGTGEEGEARVVEGTGQEKNEAQARSGRDLCGNCYVEYFISCSINTGI